MNGSFFLRSTIDDIRGARGADVADVLRKKNDARVVRARNYASSLVAENAFVESALFFQ